MERKDLEEKERTQGEIQCRINEVSEAFRACREFIEQHPEVHYAMKDAQAREHASPQRPQRNTEAKASHSRGRLCHTSIAWDEMS